jgi:hypothetical protein
MTALARASSNCKRQTRPLIREGAPNGCFVPRQTGRLTVGRNITLTLTFGIEFSFLLATDTEVAGLIPGATRFSEK